MKNGSQKILSAICWLTVGCLLADCWPTVFIMWQTKVSANRWLLIYGFNNHVEMGKINCRKIISMAIAQLAWVGWQNMPILVRFHESFWVTDCQPTVLTRLYIPIFGTSTDSRLLANGQPTVGWRSADSWSTVGQQSVDRWPTASFGNCSSL